MHRVFVPLSIFGLATVVKSEIRSVGIRDNLAKTKCDVIGAFLGGVCGMADVAVLTAQAG